MREREMISLPNYQGQLLNNFRPSFKTQYYMAIMIVPYFNIQTYNDITLLKQRDVSQYVYICLFIPNSLETAVILGMIAWQMVLRVKTSIFNQLFN